jgi:hypothetical protein
MCLYIGSKKPLVAKKDIVVYKFVNIENGKYVTPFQHTPVKVNALMIAGGGSEDIVLNSHHKYIINGGAIHACTSSYNDDFCNVCLKAYIKEGTEFWVQDDFKEIAARSLYITNEVVTDRQNTDMAEICKTLICDAPTNKDGVRIGDVLLSDKTYASPLGDFDKSKVIGYVACFNPHDDSPIHVGIKNEYLSFLADYKCKNSCHSNITPDKIANDFEGYKHTYDIANADDYNAKLFKAIDYCINYSTEGTNKGDWHLGATGELIAIAKNLIFINSAIILAGIGETFNLSWSWTSSQFFNTHITDETYVLSWSISSDDGSCSILWNSQYYDFQVRPLLAFIKQL